jgi:beta-glucanase (GH16 family)
VDEVRTTSRRAAGTVLVAGLFLGTVSCTRDSAQPEQGRDDAPTVPGPDGWTLRDSDEFDGSRLDLSRWRVYDGPGNAGVGLRRPSAVTVEDGALAIEARGDVSGGIAWFGEPTTYGRWEFRARADAGSGYGQAILLWPDSDRWPEDGEVDVMEIIAPNRDELVVTVHYGADDQQESVTVPGDFTQWHTYAVEWEPDHVTVLLDGERVFTTTNPAAVPDVPMHLAIQNDVGPLPGWIPARDAETPDVVGLHVDWVRLYERGGRP